MMQQEEQFSKLTKLKELLDSGHLSEEEFATEKAKVMASSEKKPSSASKQSATNETNIGPANVGLSSGIVLTLCVLAIILTLIEAIFEGLADSGYYGFDYSTYCRFSGLCGFLASAAVLILWICAFNKLSTMIEGKQLGRIPLWTYLYLGGLLVFYSVYIADPMMFEESETELQFLELLAFFALLLSLFFGYIAHISLYKAYSGKMRTYSTVWLIVTSLLLILLLFSEDLILTIIEEIIDTGIYVFLMIALLEKRR